MSKADPVSAFVMTTSIYAVAGRLGISNGMDTSTQDSVNEDDDGELNINYIVDLSHCLSEQLGRQMPMMATYRVLGFGISLRNVDDLNDNDYGLAVGGTVNWYVPTKHRINALQYAREYKRTMVQANLSSSADGPFAPWPNDRKYRGLRFNWSDDTDGVEGAIADNTTMLTGTNFAIREIFDKYNQAIGGIPLEEGYDTAGGYGDALWETRTGYLNVDSVYWNAYYRNATFVDNATFNSNQFDPECGPWEHRAPAAGHYPVLGGLLKVNVAHSNTDNPKAAEVEDDMYLQFHCLVAGWEEF